MPHKIHQLLSMHTTLMMLLEEAEGRWSPFCIYGRCDSAHLGDRKCIPFHTTGTAYSGVPCVILTIFDSLKRESSLLSGVSRVSVPGLG